MYEIRFLFSHWSTVTSWNALRKGVLQTITVKKTIKFHIWVPNNLDLLICSYLNIYILKSLHDIVPFDISWKRKKTSSLLTF